MKKAKLLRKELFRGSESGGITLIALVVTIIALLILAGVSISLVAGGDGILKKASNAVDTNTIATAKEEVELKIAEVLIDYYEDVYVNKDYSVDTTKQAYIEEKCAAGVTYSNYEFTIQDGVVTIKATANNGLSSNITGAMDVNGSITWNNETGSVTPKDTEKPTITALNATSSYITIEYQDTESGVDGYALRTDETQPAISEFNTYPEVSLTGRYSTQDHNLKIQHGTLYYVYVKDAEGNISDASTVNTSEIPSNTISFDQYGTNCTISTTSADYIIEYKINSIEEGGWTIGTSVTNLKVGDTIYARLTDGTANHSTYSSHTVASIETVPDAEEHITYNLNYVRGTNKYTCELSTDTTYTIEYSINSIFWDDYVEYTNVITDIESYNDNIYVRLTDGTHYGDYKTIYIKDDFDAKTDDIVLANGGSLLTVSASGIDHGMGWADFSINITNHTNYDVEYVLVNMYDDPATSVWYSVHQDEYDGSNNYTGMCLGEIIEDGISFYLYVRLTDGNNYSHSILVNAYYDQSDS